MWVAQATVAYRFKKVSRKEYVKAHDTICLMSVVFLH